MKKFKILTISVFFLTLVFCSAKADQNVEENAQKSPKTEQISEKTDKNADFWAETDQNEAGYGHQLLTSILFLAVLCTLGYFVSKKLLPNVKIRDSKNLKVCETVKLSPGRNLHVIEIKNKGRILIGSTNNNITLISNLDSDSTGE